MATLKFGGFWFGTGSISWNFVLCISLVPTSKCKGWDLLAWTKFLQSFTQRNARVNWSFNIVARRPGTWDLGGFIVTVRTTGPCRLMWKSRPMRKLFSCWWCVESPGTQKHVIIHNGNVLISTTASSIEREPGAWYLLSAHVTSSASSRLLLISV